MKLIFAALIAATLAGCASGPSGCTVNYNITLPPISEGSPKAWTL